MLKANAAPTVTYLVRGQPAAHADHSTRSPSASLGGTRRDIRRETATPARQAERDWVFQTLRRTWPQDYPRPQFAFRISMLNVSCNSHYFSQLAASFIDARAE